MKTNNNNNNNSGIPLPCITLPPVKVANKRGSLSGNEMSQYEVQDGVPIPRAGSKVLNLSLPYEGKLSNNLPPRLAFTNSSQSMHLGEMAKRRMC